MINCLNCLNLRAKIKLKNNRLQSIGATAFCRYGILWNNQRDEPDTYNYNKKAWNEGSYVDWHRESCVYYEPEEDIE